MSIKYDKLFQILKERGHSSNYWLRQNGIHSATASKLKKNERVNTDTINTLCTLLNVQPGDILEFVPDSEPDSTQETTDP